MTNRSDSRAEFLDDVMTTAVEGGINYWSAVSEYRWDRSKHAPGKIGVTVHEWHPDEGETNADGYAENGVRVTPDDIARALGKIRAGDAVTLGMHDGLIRDIRSIDRTNNGDTGDLSGQDLDAGIADCIIQVAMFGKVIYG